MRRVFLIALLVIVLTLVAAVPALAEEGGHCTSGQDFGQHVSEHARGGLLGADHNPGMHKGYSHCL